MTERPILFSAPMVRAILDGTKAQTRRVVSRHNSRLDGCEHCKDLPVDLSTAWVDEGPSPAGNSGPYLKARHTELDSVHRIYPRIRSGDRLWVRETWRAETFLSDEGYALVTVDYSADGVSRELRPPDSWTIPKSSIAGQSPSIHMPRWASRITLEVTNVRVERVQDISEEDAKAEGVDYTAEDKQDIAGRFAVGLHTLPFIRLWDSINAKRGYGWNANPYVWVIEFRKVTP